MRDLPAIEISAWDEPLGGERACQQLSAVLPDYISGRRWYRAKARTMRDLTVQDVVPVGSAAFILVLSVKYEDDACDDYILPVAIARSAQPDATDDPICRLQGAGASEGTLYSALSNSEFRQALLDAIVCESTFNGQRGDLVAQRTEALGATCHDSSTRLESFVSRAEQSNTSIIYGDRHILKLFRKLEDGVNPDIEIGNFLTRRGFKHTPAVLGNIEYKTNRGQAYAAAILQQFVPNQGDAWTYTLKSLDGFFERALAAPHEAPPQNPFEIGEEIPVAMQTLLGGYVDSAALLGKRTAQMHAAFEDETAGPDFIPEPFTSDDAQKLSQDLLSQADIAFELLRRKQAALTGSAAEAGRAVLRLESEVMNRFAAIREFPVSAVRIRHHGDYHLGQVLYTGRDFMIIDFEGEPARPLSERRRKALAMRDVAGMLRSFQYAAYASLFGQARDMPNEPTMSAAAESWAAFWTGWVAAIYLRAYFAEGRGLRSVPSNIAEKKLLLDVFLLQKALYELIYESNNRPDWIRIPLRGILGLVSQQAN